MITGAEDDGLRNLDVELADLAEELNKEDGPRIRIFVDQKVFRKLWFHARSPVTLLNSWLIWLEIEYLCMHQMMIDDE